MDTTIPQTTITSLPTDLGNVRAFTGMTDASDNSPTYSAHGGLTNISDGDDLELAIYKLDAALGSTVGAFETTANVTSNSPGDPTTDDFVFGSTTLDDAGVTAHDTRMLFDKSSGAFRAGTADSTQWDTRGDNSAAFGDGNTASGNNSFVGGGESSTVTSPSGAILTGNTNTVGGSASAIVTGFSNINNGLVSFIGTGYALRS